MISKEYIDNDTSTSHTHTHTISREMLFIKLDRLLRILTKPSIQLSTVIFTQRLCLPIVTRYWCNILTHTLELCMQFWKK